MCEHAITSKNDFIITCWVTGQVCLFHANSAACKAAYGDIPKAEDDEEN